MCGIIGYVGNRNVKEVLIKGLSRLQYRGYDSSGICISNGYKFKIAKEVGKIEDLITTSKDGEFSGNLGVGHTRWATHGKPSVVNCHPHFGCSNQDNQFAVVHNGIIENSAALREMLITEGHKFLSETDSEVISHLIEKFYEGDLEKAVLHALQCVEGAYGIAVLHSKSDCIVVARKGSSLVIGVGKNEMFVASDVSAILEYTQKVVYLDDNEIASVYKEGYKVKNLDLVEVDKEVHEVLENLESIEKGGFDHFMLKEIFEQGKSVEQVLRGRIREGKIKLSIDLDVSNIRRIVIVGCGTSWHSALIAKYYIEELTRIPVEVDYASQFRYRDPILSPEDIFIALSQSGETADTLVAVKEAKKKGAKVIGIVNVVNSSIAREADEGIYLHAGPEIGVASTKAFTSQLVALLLFGLYVRKLQGLGIEENIINDLKSFDDKIEQVLEGAKRVKQIAQEYVNVKSFLYLGRGVNHPVALEGALKLKEVSYIHAEGYPASEMKHGPIALIEKGFPCFFVASSYDNISKIISSIEEVRARGADVILVTDSNNSELDKLCRHVIRVKKVHKLLMPILLNIPLQLFSYYVANLKGLDVDKPRNLAKSVTVE